jgi:hypothetical protein
MPRASHYLEGHWVRMWPGAVVMAHPRRRMVVVCHRPRAQRGTSCGHRSVFTSVCLSFGTVPINYTELFFSFFSYNCTTTLSSP